MTDTMKDMGRDYHAERLFDIEEAEDTFDAPPVSPDEITSKRQRKSALRASQGGRTDWKVHLSDVPGYRHVPDNALTMPQKRARSKSLKAAAIRRRKRRENCGVTLHYSGAAWGRLKQSSRTQYEVNKSALALIGHRWDWNADFYFYGSKDEYSSLDHLFRFGSANPPKPQSFMRFHWETGCKRHNWYADELENADDE